MGRGLNRINRGGNGEGLERDIDFHNQRLWKRKQYRHQKDKDQKKKNFQNYKKMMESESQEALAKVDDKQRKFYENLFTSEPKDSKNDEKKPQQSDTNKNQSVKKQKKKSPKVGNNAKNGFKQKFEQIK